MIRRASLAALRFMPSIVIALTALLAACSACGDNEGAIRSASSLSQARLARFFRDLQSLDTASGQHRLHLDAGTGIPDTFHDLAPQSITIDGHIARVHLSGCADDKVILIAKGLDNSRDKEITLLAGEAQGAQTLWRSR